MKKAFVGLLSVILVVSCQHIEDKANKAIDSGAQAVGNAIDSGAQAVGKTATDVVNNIDIGITKSSKVDIRLSEDLKKSGLSSGKYYVRKDDEGNENVLSVYLISDKNIERQLSAKLFDKNEVEMGRAKLMLKQAKGDAGYHDFVFDPKISFEYQSKLVIE